MIKGLSVASSIVLCLLPCASLGQDHRFLTKYAVHIEMTLEKSWTGYGIYLGNGLVLTAEHVARPASLTHPKVLIARLVLPATVVVEGDFEKIDVTLLKIDQTQLPPALQGPQISLCTEPPYPDQAVVTVIPEGIARSTILAPDLLPKNIPAQFSTLIKDVATTGNSGSGVFDAKTNCLLGIMSRKLQETRTVKSATGEVSITRDVAKFFEPASKIAQLIPAGLLSPR